MISRGSIWVWSILPRTDAGQDHLSLLGPIRLGHDADGECRLPRDHPGGAPGLGATLGHMPAVLVPIDEIRAMPADEQPWSTALTFRGGMMHELIMLFCQ